MCNRITLMAALLPLVLTQAAYAQVIQATRQQVQNLPPPLPVIFPLEEAVHAPFDTRTPIMSLPFTVDGCGSYFLTGCLAGVPGEHGITVTASDVTLDLNGFTLKGVAGSLDGIHVNGGLENVRVRGGGVRNWGGHGIALYSSRSRLSNFQSYDNGGDGIQFLQAGLDDITSSGNDGDGVEATGSGYIRDCETSSNGNNGVFLGPLSGKVRVFGHSSSSEGGAGLRAEGFGHTGSKGIYANSPVAISVASAGCTFTVNIALQCITAYDVDSTSWDNRIEGNHASNSPGTGFRIDGTNNVVIKNSASSNGTNYTVMPGNDVAPISTAAAATSCNANISN